VQENGEETDFSSKVPLDKSCDVVKEQKISKKHRNLKMKNKNKKKGKKASKACAQRTNCNRT